MAEESDTNVKEPLKDDSVSSLIHDQSSNETASARAASDPESRAKEFSSRIKQYPTDELHEYSEGKSLIGSGGFGDVRKYHHKDRIVAIKEFAIAGDEGTIAKIWNMVVHEANILCRFRHENIVEILGITQRPNIVGIIMEFVEGGNLENILSGDNQSKLFWKDRLQIAKGITSGLNYIHNYGEKKTFCHGDLKPANVLLTNDLQVKLADFGSAGFHRATAASTTTMKKVSTTQFTLIYVAPEFLLDNTRGRNPAMDMYSFGMVLYELISGKAPYSDSTMPMHVPALIMANIKPSAKLIDDAENQLQSDDDRGAFKLLKKLMEKSWSSESDLRPSSKSVETELSNYLMKQSQGYIPPTTEEASATEEETATDSTARKVAEQDAESSSSGSSAPQFIFANDRSSTSHDFKATTQETMESALGDLLKSLDIFSPKQTSRAKETLEKLLKGSGVPTVFGNNTSVQDFLAKYTDCLLSKDFEQADMFRAALRAFVVNEVKAEAGEAKQFAEKLILEEKYLESVALFDTAAALHAQLKDPEEDLEQIQLCIQGMKEAIEKMFQDDTNTKVIIVDYVLPLMRHWKQEMKATTKVSEKWKCHTVSWALSNIELCELKMELWKERRESLEEAVSGMRRVFGSDVHKLHGRLFGTLLNNLGAAYERGSRIEDAARLFKESVEAHKAALDYFGNEENRSRDISISERNLKSSLVEAWEKQLKMK